MGRIINNALTVIGVVLLVFGVVITIQNPPSFLKPVLLPTTPAPTPSSTQVAQLATAQPSPTQTALVSPTRQPTTEQSSSQDSIVFEKWIKFPDREAWGYQVELWIIHSSGSGLRRLTQGYYDTDPAWAPNGRSIAFSRSGPETQGIFSIDSDGTNLRRVSSNQRAYAPQWVTNSRLLFTSRRGTEEKLALQWRLVAISIDKSDERVIDVGLSGVFSPVISPDHQRVVFTAGDNKDIYIAGVGGENMSRLGTAQNPVRGYPRRWYPDGRFLLIDSDTDCIKVGLDGSKVETVVGIEECNMAWSPDKNRVVYQFNDAIWTMNSDGQNKRLLIAPSDKSIYKNPVWSP